MGKARYNPSFSVPSQYCQLVILSRYLFRLFVVYPDMKIIKISGLGEHPSCYNEWTSACTLMLLDSHQFHVANGFVVVP